MSIDTQTLRERFENQYCDDPDTYSLFLARNAQGEYEQAVARLAFIWFVRGCQSGAEDNQCVVELPLHISVEISYGLRSNFMLASEVIAAIEASGARIK